MKKALNIEETVDNNQVRCPKNSFRNVTKKILVHNLKIQMRVNIKSLAMRNHVKLIHVVTSRRGFSRGAVLCGGC